jgi:acyl dehydratase
MPEGRAPDHQVTIKTSPYQAMIYRLSGDYNPLHIDPKVARQGGFTAPILHGLCSYGIAGRAVLRALCDNDPARIKRFDVRFSSPVYPGETILTEIWVEGSGKAAYRAKVVERDVVVLNNGYVEFNPPRSGEGDHAQHGGGGA